MCGCVCVCLWVCVCVGGGGKILGAAFRSFFIIILFLCKRAVSMCRSVCHRAVYFIFFFFVFYLFSSVRLSCRIYRASVEELLDDEQVSVRFGDYGNTQVCARADLCVVPTTCTDLPLQAIRCALAEVEPDGENGEWLDETVNQFSQLLSDDMIATVTCVEPDAPVLVRLQADGENVAALLFGDAGEQEGEENGTTLVGGEQAVDSEQCQEETAPVVENAVAAPETATTVEPQDEPENTSLDAEESSTA